MRAISFNRFVPVFRIEIDSGEDNTRSFQWYRNSEVYEIGIICSAPTDVDRSPVGTFESGMKNTIRSQIKVAIINSHDSIVLGAFGCGAFLGNPDIVAQLYRQVLVSEDLAKYFKEVHFAALVARPSDQENYEAFERYLLAPV